MPAKGKENKKLQKINDDNYALIKVLAESGVTKAAICKALHMSSATIYRVLGSESIKDYREQVKVLSDESRARQLKTKKPETKTVNEMLDEAFEKKPTIDFSEADIQIVVEILNKILEKVSIIADNTDRGRGLFRR